MKVGKSGIVQCDFCGSTCNGEHDSLTREGVTRHYCRGGCLDKALREQFNDLIVKEVDRKVRGEFNDIHKQVCPACKWRLRNLR
jgi:hypothetical protein